ncbi:MAG: hypothetical protein JKY65_29345 [Planctomycetes bacterium]|nr:hypothetical protein [Planctomycetota bacterium]
MLVYALLWIGLSVLGFVIGQVDEELLEDLLLVFPWLTQTRVMLTCIGCGSLAMVLMWDSLQRTRRRYGACTARDGTLIFEPALIKEGHALNRIKVPRDAISHWEETEWGFLVVNSRRSTAESLIPLLIPTSDKSERVRVRAFLPEG